MSERTEALIAGARRPWIVPYLTAGFPTAQETPGLLAALEDGGADVIELGMPFSDPLADGPVIQDTSHRALQGGIRMERILELAAGFRAGSRVPVVLMGYLNPILAYGPERFFVDAAAAGVDALILPDLPPEEADSYHRAALDAGLEWIFLAAPTSTTERLARIDALSTRFSYCVSVAGVTGARDSLPVDLGAYLQRAAASFSKPFVVGFGISRADQIAALCPPAAGIVVGSALLRELDSAADAAARRQSARRFVETLRGKHG